MNANRPRSLNLFMRGGLRFGLGACCSLGLLAAEDAQPEVAEAGKDACKVLVQKLGDADFDTREDALTKLKQLGEKARTALEDAAKDTDPEVSHAANVLLKNINRAQVVVLVVGPDEKPLAGVDVYLNLSRMAGGGRVIAARQNTTVKSDKDGVAVFGYLDPDMYFVNMGANAQGFLPANLGKANQKLGVGKNEFKLACQRGGSIKGVLLTAERSPIVGRRVVICHPHFLRFKTQKNFAQIIGAQRGVETDEKGAFIFEALHPMEYFIAVVDGEKVVYTSNSVKLVGDQAVEMGEIATEIKAETLKVDAKAEPPPPLQKKEQVQQAVADPAVQPKQPPTPQGVETK